MSNDSKSSAIINNEPYYNIFSPSVDIWQPVYRLDTPALPPIEIETLLNPVTASIPIVEDSDYGSSVT